MLQFSAVFHINIQSPLLRILVFSADVSPYLHPVLHCNYPSDSELVDTEDHNHNVDTSGFTFSPRSTFS